MTRILCDNFRINACKYSNILDQKKTKFPKMIKASTRDLYISSVFFQQNYNQIYAHFLFGSKENENLDCLNASTQWHYSSDCWLIDTSSSV